MSLLLVVILPLLLAPLLYVAGLRYGKLVGYASSAAIALAFAVIVYYYPQVASTGGVYSQLISARIGGVVIDFAFRLDGLSLVYALCIAAVSTAVCLYSIPYMDHRFGEMGIEERSRNRAHAQFYLLYVLFYVGMIGTVLSTNVIGFYIFYEFILISTWLVIHSFGYGERAKIALTYFIWTHISGLLIFVGFIINYMATGSLDTGSFGLFTLAMPILFVGFSIKMAVFGFHTWLPLAHGEAPTPISALLSPVTIGIGAYGILRFTLPMIPMASPWLALWALVTIIYGGFVALSEDDIKRLLAYSSIGHMGYMLLGIASVSTIGLAGVTYHYLSHAFLKGILFMTAGLLMMQFGGNRSIRKMGGLASKTPLAALFLASGFLGLAGFPPFAGFNSKLLIFTGAFAGALSEDPLQLLIVIGATVSSFLTLAYGALTFKRSMMGAPAGAADEAEAGSVPVARAEANRPDWLMLASIIFLLVMSIIFFLMPSRVLLPLTG